MNKKGFSLTEILVVIAIIAIIIAIAIPSVTNMRKRVNERLFESKKEEILVNAELYGKDHPDIFQDGTEAQITIETLLIDNYLEPDLKDDEGICEGYTYGCVVNPVNNDIINGTKIIIKTQGSSYIAIWEGEMSTSMSEELIIKIKNELKCSSVTETNPCLYPANATTNYLYDSGIMWRIIGIYKIDNNEVVKMVTDNTVTWEE